MTSADKDINVTYTFDSPTIETIDIAGNLYNTVTLRDCVLAGGVGEPGVPSKGVFLLLPPESKVSKIDITPGESIILDTEYRIAPIGEAIPISQITEQPVPTPDATIYKSNTEYPGKLFTTVGVYNFRGYQLLVLLIHPLQYNPVTGKLICYTTFDVSVTTESASIQPVLYRGLEQDQKEVRQRVDNPEMTLQYDEKYAAASLSFDSYDLLIITTDALKSAFEPLQQAHDATGISTVIKTLTDIGASDLESIRNYILDAYMNWGIEYVLIGGDTDVIAAPMLWVSGMDENTTYYEDTMPADIYYACLDGPYNYDGDSKWGEPHDGTNGEDVDLVAEVYVGRACVGSTVEVNNFVTKTVAYINKNPDDEYLKETCFGGEYLGDYGIASYGGAYMDQLIDGSSDDGYTTVGIPSDEYTINKLYDAPGYDWPASAIITTINNGVHIINHLGHSSYDYNLKLYTYDVDGLNNPSDKTCFIYSQGCMAGGFDSGDCIAEHFTVKTTHAAFAGIFNARYGFFWSYSTDGDSQRLHRQFWDAVFDESIPEIGRANHDSKEDNLPIIGRSCIRWVYYETNLFGDPTLQIVEGAANSPPEKPVLPDGPSSGKAGILYTFSSNTTDPDSGDQLYYQWDWGNEVDDWLGPYSSGQLVETTHSWVTPGEYQVTVKAKDSGGLESVRSDPKTIVITAEPQIEIGTISGGFGISAEIQNIGIVNATDVNWTIVLKGLVFIGKNNMGTLESIVPDDPVEIRSGLVFGLGKISISVTVADMEKTATAFLLGPLVINIR